jgi:hypothetical protein
MGSAMPDKPVRDMGLSAASPDREWDSYFGGAEHFQNTSSQLYATRAVKSQYSSCSFSGVA